MSVSDFLDMMPHTVYLHPTNGHNAYGEPTYGSPQSFTARVIYKQQRVASMRTDHAGVEVVSMGVVWLAGNPTIDVDSDKLQLPDETEPLILAYETIPDEDGSHHTKIYFGKITSG